MDTISPLHNPASEEALLGGIFAEPAIFPKVASKIEPQAFHSPQHRLIFRAMVSLADQRAVIDLLTVQAELVRGGQLEEAGGLPYLAELATKFPTAASWEYHLRQVHSLAFNRKKASLHSKIAAAQQEGNEQLVGQLEQELEDLKREQVSFAKIEPFDIQEALYRLKEEQPGKKLPKSWGILKAGMGAVRDAAIFRPEELTIIGARSAHGKTSFLLNLAFQWLKEGPQKLPVLIFSAEEGEGPFTKRLLSMATRELAGTYGSGLKSDKIEDCNRSALGQGNAATGSDIKQFNEAMIWYEKEVQPELFWQYAAGWSTKDLLNYSLATLGQKGPLAAIMVDYLGLLKARIEDKYAARYHEVAQIAYQLKELAVICKCPVIAAAQVGRGSSAIPGMEDFKESGGIENAGDLLLTICNHTAHRDQLGKEIQGLDPNKRDQKEKELTSFKEGLLTVKIVKNRHGESGAEGDIGFDAKTRFFCDQQDLKAEF